MMPSLKLLNRSFLILALGLSLGVAGCSSGQCKGNSDCATSTGHVCSAGSCVVCAGDTDCPMNHKCNNQTACVECLASTDCAKGQLCQSNACVVGCDSGSICPANTVCNVSLKSCVQCNTDKDCAAPTGRCEQTTHSCVGCTRDDDCAAGQVCHSQTCTSGCSAQHAQCPMGQVCNTSVGACVECLSDANCKGAAPRCDGSQGKCVSCLPSNDNCVAGTYCAGTTCTTGCSSDAGCSLGQVCMNHACTSGCNAQHACPGGQGCCDSLCVSVLSDVKNCGGCGVVCPSGAGCCGGACVPLTTITNCGGCGATCADVANGTRSCKAGSCGIGVCSSSFADCNMDPSDGCEADLRSAANCGICGKLCPAPTNAQAACTSGQCGLGVCNTGFADCDAVAANGCEVTLASDAKNCGKCGSVCAPANAMGGCMSGTCTINKCSTGFADCDKNAANGCEVDITSDAKNCNGCGIACDASKGEICAAGKCGNPLQYEVLDARDVTYQGINYVALKVRFRSATSLKATWCDEYQALCASYNASPTGCGQTYTNGNSGYATCRNTYGSNGISDSLSCNPSSGIAAAASQAGFAGANPSNSFGFHYCDSNTCSKTMCTSQYCQTALTYFHYDPANVPFGFTLCKK